MKTGRAFWIGLIYLLTIGLVRQVCAGNIGNDFWVQIPFIEISASVPKKPALRFTSKLGASGSISAQGFSTSFSVPANGATTVFLPASLMHGGGEGVSDLGIHITSQSNAIAVEVCNEATAGSESYLAIPTQELGYDHYLMSYPGSSVSGNRSSFYVMATQDNTVITVQPMPGVSFPGHGAGVPYTVNLNQGQVYYLNVYMSSVDVTGTRILADKPVCVYGASALAQIPVGTRAGNSLAEQIPPVGFFGSEYLLRTLKDRPQYRYRVMGLRDNTSIMLDGTPLTSLNPGQVAEYVASGNHVLTSDKPMVVAQFEQGTEIDAGSEGDPNMMLIVPTKQLKSEYILAPSDFVGQRTHAFYNYANICTAASNINGVFLNGSQVPSGNFSPNGSYVCGTVDLGSVMTAKTLSSANPIGVQFYGHASYDGFAMMGGFGDCLALFRGNSQAPLADSQGGSPLIESPQYPVLRPSAASSDPDPDQWLAYNLTTKTHYEVPIADWPGSVHGSVSAIVRMTNGNQNAVGKFWDFRSSDGSHYLWVGIGNTSGLLQIAYSGLGGVAQVWTAPVRMGTMRDYEVRVEWSNAGVRLKVVDLPSGSVFADVTLSDRLDLTPDVMEIGSSAGMGSNYYAMIDCFQIGCDPSAPNGCLTQYQQCKGVLYQGNGGAPLADTNAGPPLQQVGTVNRAATALGDPDPDHWLGANFAQNAYFNLDPSTWPGDAGGSLSMVLRLDSLTPPGYPTPGNLLFHFRNADNSSYLTAQVNALGAITLQYTRGGGSVISGSSAPAYLQAGHAYEIRVEWDSLGVRLKRKDLATGSQDLTFSNPALLSLNPSTLQLDWSDVWPTGLQTGRMDCVQLDCHVDKANPCTMAIVTPTPTPCLESLYRGNSAAPLVDSNGGPALQEVGTVSKPASIAGDPDPDQWLGSNFNGSNYYTMDPAVWPGDLGGSLSMILRLDSLTSPYNLNTGNQVFHFRNADNSRYLMAQVSPQGMLTIQYTKADGSLVTGSGALGGIVPGHTYEIRVEWDVSGLRLRRKDLADGIQVLDFSSAGVLALSPTVLQLGWSDRWGSSLGTGRMDCVQLDCQPTKANPCAVATVTPTPTPTATQCVAGLYRGNSAAPLADGNGGLPLLEFGSVPRPGTVSGDPDPDQWLGTGFSASNYYLLPLNRWPGQAAGSLSVILKYRGVAAGPEQLIFFRNTPADRFLGVALNSDAGGSIELHYIAAGGSNVLQSLPHGMEIGKSYEIRTEWDSQGVWLSVKDIQSGQQKLWPSAGGNKIGASAMLDLQPATMELGWSTLLNRGLGQSQIDCLQLACDPAQVSPCYSAPACPVSLYRGNSAAPLADSNGGPALQEVGSVNRPAATAFDPDPDQWLGTGFSETNHYGINVTKWPGQAAGSFSVILNYQGVGTESEQLFMFNSPGASRFLSADLGPSGNETLSLHYTGPGGTAVIQSSAHGMEVGKNYEIRTEWDAGGVWMSVKDIQTGLQKLAPSGGGYKIGSTTPMELQPTAMELGWSSLAHRGLLASRIDCAQIGCDPSSANPCAVPVPTPSPTPTPCVPALYRGNSAAPLADSNGGPALQQVGTVSRPAAGSLDPDPDQWLGTAFSASNYYKLAPSEWPGQAQGSFSLVLNYQGVDTPSDQLYLFRNAAGDRYVGVDINSADSGMIVLHYTSTGGADVFRTVVDGMEFGKNYEIRTEWGAGGVWLTVKDVQTGAQKLLTSDGPKLGSTAPLELAATDLELGWTTLWNRGLGLSRIDCAQLACDASVANPCAVPVVTPTPSPSPSYTPEISCGTCDGICQDWEQSQDLNAWTKVGSGSMQVQARPGGLHELHVDGEVKAWVPSFSATNYVIEAEVRRGGIARLIGNLDPGSDDYTCQSCYMLAVNDELPGGEVGLLVGDLNGYWPMVTSYPSVSYPSILSLGGALGTADSYRLKLEKTATELRGYVNGVLQIVAPLPGTPLGAGRAGILVDTGRSEDFLWIKATDSDCGGGGGLAAHVSPRKAPTPAPQLPGGRVAAFSPNPAGAGTELLIQVPEQGRIGWHLFGLSGEPVDSGSAGQQDPGLLHVPLDLGRLASGVYLAVVTLDRGEGPRVLGRAKLAVVH